MLAVNQDGTVSPAAVDLSGKANESTIAPEFDSFTTYTAGQYVYKNGVLYKFTSAHSGAWTGSDAVVVTVGGEVDKATSKIKDLAVEVEISGDTVTGSESLGVPADDLVISIPYSSTPTSEIDFLSAGINLLPMNRCVSAGYNLGVGQTISITPTGKKWGGVNGVYTTEGVASSWSRDYGLCSPLLAKGQTYRIYLTQPTGNPRCTIYVLDSNNVITRQENRGNPMTSGFSITRTLTGDECRIVISMVGSGAEISVTKPFIWLTTNDDKTGPTDYNIHEYTANLNGITDFYGGTYDPVSGLVISKYASDGTTLSIPVTYSIDPIIVEIPTGDITVMSSKGGIDKLIYKTGTQSAINKIQEDIDSYNADIENIYTKRVDESKRYTSGDNIDYYPCDFKTGNDYVVKIKFDEYVSTTTRKYSLRITSERYVTGPYQCGWIVIIDNINPEVGKEYVYRFKAGLDPSNRKANYLAVELNTNVLADANVQLYSIKAEDAQADVDKLEYITATDIVSLNHDVPNCIAQGDKPLNRATTNPLKLMHFSDIHANQVNLARLVEFKKSLGTTIDDTICTGDMVSNNYSETCMDFWDAVEGSESILMIVGNHELADGSHGYSSDQIGQTVAYQKYFSPYVSNWGVTMAGENLTYWYKDYASRKVRLIGINYLLTGDAMTAQNAWLTERLTEAKANGYTVVIAVHTPPNAYTRIDCNFAEIGIGWTYNEMPTSIQDVVETFITGGGEFACYIGGHAHRDLFGYNLNYPSQIFINVTTAQTTGANNDQYRANGTKSQDAANIFMVDTVTKTVKLIRVGADMDCYLRGRHMMSINYKTKAIIANS